MSELCSVVSDFRFPLQQKILRAFDIGRGPCILRDYEIFGSHGWRVKFIQDLTSSHHIKMLLHPHFFPPSLQEHYQEEVQRWKDILGKASFHQMTQPLSEGVFWELFEQVFPITRRSLGVDGLSLFRAYLKQVDINSLNFHDIFRYFPFFLKQELRIAPKLGELSWQMARWEWLLCELEYMEAVPRNEPTKGDYYQLNPTAFIVNQEFPIDSLGLSSGVFAIFNDPQTLQTKTYRLQRQEAQILDLLEEEAAWTESQLLEILGDDVFEPTLKIESPSLGWVNILKNLESIGLIERNQGAKSESK